MARKLRIQYPGALYHVINRGNYRRAVFETSGAAQSFQNTLGEACGRYDWRIHAYTLMCNHYHFALETPGANLVEGMHWLQGTFATRFNRFRTVHGHLFQGRYKALLVENASTLLRVVNYIDLNPVRAGIVLPQAVATFESGSLKRFVAGNRPQWLVADTICTELDLGDTTSGWSTYVEYLTSLAGDGKRQQQLGFDKMCQGWAIGTAGWRQALAKEYSAMALESGFEREELREIKEERWWTELRRLLRTRADVVAECDLAAQPLNWKVKIAAHLRCQTGAPYRWLAAVLKIDRPSSLRTQVRRCLLQAPA